MSYTIEDLTSIDDAIFDTLWDASFPRIESGGTMPWAKYEVHSGHTLTEEEKKKYSIWNSRTNLRCQAMITNYTCVAKTGLLYDYSALIKTPKVLQYVVIPYMDQTHWAQELGYTMLRY